MSATSTELEETIKGYIKELYKAEYKGYLKVELLNPGYKLKLGIPSYMIQTSIACNYETDAEFLAYIKQELASRNYIRQDVYKTVRTSDTREE